MPMIAMTTSNSTSVNARRTRSPRGNAPSTIWHPPLSENRWTDRILRPAARMRSRGLAKNYERDFEFRDKIEWRAIHQFQPEESATRRFQVTAATASAVRS